MSKYIIKRVERQNIKLSDEIWDTAEAARIDNRCGNSEYVLDAKAYLLYNDKGIAVKFVTDEIPYVRYFNHNDPVNRDSAAEFFFNSGCQNDNRYINIEVNAAGVMQIGIGEGETGREKIYCGDYSVFGIETGSGGQGWKLKLFIPFAFINKYFGKISGSFKGNLYKCGDRTPKPHYLSWAPLGSPHFHRPEFFGNFILEGY
jgi:hypothetical protein